jgi:hypothetical protein
MKVFRSKVIGALAVILVATQLVVACAPAASAASPAAAPAYGRDPGYARVAPTAMPMPASSNSSSGIDALVFQQAVRKLWEDHITWTRVYIVAAAAGLPETDTAAQRLLQNQTDLGNAIKPFYGDAAGEKLTALLKDHILIAADLIVAAKAGDNAKVTEASARWYANADQIAAFLHSANPDQWSLADMKSMMKTHLDLTLEEATARLHGDWSADIAAYDKVHSEILDMADMLSAGIVAQFPGKFAASHASQKEIALTLAMNKLWEDHITWTRLYIISATSGLPDADATAKRLLQNQVDIGDAIKPLYGDAAGTQLTALLNDHILTAAGLLAAAKSGDTAKFEAAKQHWYANADEIAAFLSSANPTNWPLSDTQAMMKSHLDLTLEEATARLNGDWAGDVAAYDKVHGEILDMAAMLTNGIVAQFPDQFK